MLGRDGVGELGDSGGWELRGAVGRFARVWRCCEATDRARPLVAWHTPAQPGENPP